MHTKELQSVLNGEYLGDLTPGHMGARLMRFRRTTDNMLLVVKFAPSDCEGAIHDLESNINGYRELANLGAESMLIPEFKEVPVEGGRALVMIDAGPTMGQANLGITGFAFFWKHFQKIVQATLQNATSRHYEQEVLSGLRRFEWPGRAIAEQVQQSLIENKMEKQAVMLLDFTPDNVFVSAEHLFFVDPWTQNSYLGNPAVSVGQLITLARLSGMYDAEEGSQMLRESALQEFPRLLGCEVGAINQGLRLGQTLQLTLSAHVRRQTEPAYAAELIHQANALWK
jgi:hypothetical protein